MKKKFIQPNIYQYEKLLLSLECTPKHFVNLVILKKSFVIKHLPVLRVEYIKKILKKSSKKIKNNH